MNIKRIVKSVLLFPLLLIGCSSPELNKDIEKLFPSPTEDNKCDLQLTSIDIEPFALDSVESSYIGYLEMKQDTLYLIDKRFCWIFRFTKDGRLIDRQLGLGEGPKEYNCGIIEGYCHLQDGTWAFLDPGAGCNLFSNSFDRQKRLQIIREGSEENKSYENPHMYTADYGFLILRQMGSYLYYNVVAWQGMAEDFISNTNNYFRNDHILMKMNLKTGKVEQLLGGFRSHYEKKHAVFQQVSFDINQKEECFFVSYDADSLIYCYDKDYKSLYSFGWQGQDMKVDYRTYSIETTIKERPQIRSEYSYYHDIKYIEELGLLFRPYKKSPDSETDGLQIYRGQTLIADVAVLKGMVVLGYSAPYVYGTTGMDGICESVDMFRFKLE